jgi:hypothetical protein
MLQITTKYTRMTTAYTKYPYSRLNGHKIYQHLPLQGPSRFAQFGIFGLKIYHLATRYLSMRQMRNATISSDCSQNLNGNAVKVQICQNGLVGRQLNVTRFLCLFLGFFFHLCSIFSTHSNFIVLLIFLAIHMLSSIMLSNIFKCYAFFDYVSKMPNCRTHSKFYRRPNSLTLESEETQT